jgi:branched-chain amino acid transport system ATP-binding protein
MGQTMKALVVDKICKSFGGLQALFHVSLEVNVGERRVIIGPNGAGKTTLLHTISGILSPNSGAVYLFGENVTRLPLHRRANLQLSQTFQLINLFKKLTVLENVAMALQSFKGLKYTLYNPLSRYPFINQEAEASLKEWEFWEKRNIPVSVLSYGDQRLLDIMLALVSKPRLLLMDEPTSGLSSIEKRVVISKVKALTREITVLFIEHNMDVALDLAERVTVLHMGELVAEGTPAEIRRDSQVKKIYLGTE